MRVNPQVIHDNNADDINTSQAKPSQANKVYNENNNNNNNKPMKTKRIKKINDNKLMCKEKIKDYIYID